MAHNQRRYLISTMSRHQTSGDICILGFYQMSTDLSITWAPN